MRPTRLFLWHLATCLHSCAAARPRLAPPPPFNDALDSGTYGLAPERHYVTSEHARSPETNFVQCSPQYDDGLFTFATPRGHSLPKPGPTIFDARGELIWFHHYENDFGGEAYNFGVQNFKGQDYLTFWLGDDRVRGHGAGYYYMLNSSYDIVRKFGAANGLAADLHEFLITPDDTALLTAYEIIEGDVTMFRDFHPEFNPDDQDANYIWDGIVQEIDVDSGELLFEWRASDHVNITETYRPIYTMGNLNDPFDWFHINSIQKDELGNFLISARYTHSVTYVDRQTREPIWQLGGKRNSFMDLSGGNATNFAWQHDARVHDPNSFPHIYTPPPERPGVTTKLISMFDNAAEDQHFTYGMHLSRGLLLEITYPTPGTDKAKAGPVKTPPRTPESTLEKAEQDANVVKLAAINGTDPDYTVRVIKSYENPNAVRSSSQGNMQILPQGPGKDPKILLGYGLDALWTEFASNGSVICNVHYGPRASWDTAHIQSYRVYKFDWTGTPEWEPSVKLSDDNALLYVSWLGATDVREWEMQAARIDSASEQDWTELGRVPKNTFETAIAVPPDLAELRYLRIVALADNSKRMPYGTSKTVDRGILASVFPAAADALPKTVSRMSSVKIFWLVVCNVSGLVILYELYRRYLTWRLGRPAAGAFRWRKGVTYRLLGDV